jgi:hypothetical protein
MTLEVRKLATPSVKDRVSAEEWDTRVNLAACYRLAAHSCAIMGCSPAAHRSPKRST